MAPGPVACTADPAQHAARDEDFRALLGKARSIERLTRQHLRMALDPSAGLDISVLAEKMRCCAWFDFRLTPTTDGTVTLDIRVPANTGPVRGPAPEQRGTGGPEDVLDMFAQVAAGDAGHGEGEALHGRDRAARQCDAAEADQPLAW